MECRMIIGFNRDKKIMVKPFSLISFKGTLNKDKLLPLIQKAQKLTGLPDRKLPYIMTISTEKERRSCLVRYCANSNTRNVITTRYGYFIRLSFS